MRVIPTDLDSTGSNGMTAHYIVEADGGSRGNPGPAAYGTVVRSGTTGEVVAEQADYLGVATNNIAEYSGVLAGLEIVANLDSRASVEARLDSKLIVEQMSGRWKIKHPEIRAIALRVRDAFPAAQVRYTWVPRAQNVAADALVNESLDNVAAGLSGRIDRFS